MICEDCAHRADLRVRPCQENPDLMHVNPNTGEPLRCSGVHAPVPSGADPGPGLVPVHGGGCGMPCEVVGCTCQHRGAWGADRAAVTPPDETVNAEAVVDDVPVRQCWRNFPHAPHRTTALEDPDLPVAVGRCPGLGTET